MVRMSSLLLSVGSVDTRDMIRYDRAQNSVVVRVFRVFP